MVECGRLAYRSKAKVNEQKFVSSNLLSGKAGRNRFRKGRQPFKTDEICGEVAEWSNAADSKSVVLLVGTGGSNPPLSAMLEF